MIEAPAGQILSVHLSLSGLLHFTEKHECLKNEHKKFYDTINWLVYSAYPYSHCVLKPLFTTVLIHIHFLYHFHTNSHSDASEATLGSVSCPNTLQYADWRSWRIHWSSSHSCHKAGLGAGFGFEPGPGLAVENGANERSEATEDGAGHLRPAQIYRHQDFQSQDRKISNVLEGSQQSIPMAALHKI